MNSAEYILIQAVRDSASYCNLLQRQVEELQVITGKSFEEIVSLFRAGWTLKPPKECKMEDLLEWAEAQPAIMSPNRFERRKAMFSKRKKGKRCRR